MPESVVNLLAAIVSIGGISIGFLATAKSILVSIDDREIITKLKRVGSYKRIMSYMRSAIRWSFGLTIVSAAVLLVDLKDSSDFKWTFWHACAFFLWIWLAVGATLSYYRVISIFYAVLGTMEE